MPLASTTHMSLVEVSPSTVTRLKVRGLLMTQDGSQEMKNIEAIEIFDVQRSADINRLSERLAVLKNIADEDFSPPSATICEDALRVLTRVLVDEPEIPRPKLFPTLAGGLQAEWVMDPWVVDVEFESASVSVGATNGVTGEERARLFHISSEPAKQLAGFLKGLM